MKNIFFSFVAIFSIASVRLAFAEPTDVKDNPKADCDIVGCGFTLGNVYGRGFLMVGSSGKTKFAAERCTFAGNRAGGAKNQYDVGTGHGAALMNLARATFDDCLFVTNGLSVVSSPADYLMNFNVNLPDKTGYYDATKPIGPRVAAKRDRKAPVEDIIVCDGSDYTIKIYRGTNVVWRWCAAEDKTFAGNEHNDLRGRYNGLTEVRICDYKGRKVVAISSTNCAWAIVDIATTNAIAYGYSRTAGQPVRNTIMPHSIALLPNDIVAVASTYTIDQNAPETKYGCYFYHIAGDKATSYKDPAKQGATFFSIENPHGFYWDDKNKKLYVSSSEGLTRLNVEFNAAKNKFEIEEDAVFGISQLGAKWGHDLALVPGTRILAMTTYEMTLFFDMDKEKWLLDEIVWRMDIKGFDPHRDKVHVLATVPRSQYVTDTLEIWTREGGFKDYLKVPGAKFYKARWAGGAL